MLHMIGLPARFLFVVPLLVMPTARAQQPAPQPQQAQTRAVTPLGATPLLSSIRLKDVLNGSSDANPHVQSTFRPRTFPANHSCLLATFLMACGG